MKKIRILILVAAFFPLGLPAADWPMYKGNIYFTGNNDEIAVKNANLKWLFQASHVVYNPIVSDGGVYFIDMTKNVYCLDEDTGKLRWKVNLTEISKVFYASSKALGKVKYPLIRGERIYLTDNIALYCLDKRSGAVIWARTGMRDEKTIHDPKSWKAGKSGRFRPGGEKDWNPAETTRAQVDGIYTDPVLSGDRIYYGTRKTFIARETGSGHILWHSSEIESYSGFPSVYDEYLFTQSMDYSTNRFTLFCLNASDGKAVWKKNLPVPQKIFPPVIYDGKVFMPIDKKLYCMSVADGSPVWEKEYSDYVTSSPSFTEREIFFTEGNRRVLSVDPADGKILSSYDAGAKSSPYFVIVRDQIYVASTFKKEVGGREVSFASVKSVNPADGKSLWEFTSPFPGGAFQPAANGGIMFQPAGNYLYAIGTDYYPSIIDGGDAIYDPYNKEEENQGDDKERGGKNKLEGDKKPDGGKKPDEKKPDEKKSHPAGEFRKIKIAVKDKDGRTIPAEIEIKKWDKGKVVYSKKMKLRGGDEEIEIPDADDVEITADADGYVPKKEVVSRNDENKNFELDKIEKGKSIVVDNIHFEVSSAYLRKESLNILDRMIESMKRNPSIKLEIIGHTDSTGGAAFNKKLSRRRADAVADYMVKHGISPSRVKGKGMGMDKPVADNKTAAGRKKNRRTEFLVIDK